MGEVTKQTILFFGKTGSGKSRLINLLLQNTSAPSHRSATSVTRKCAKYKYISEDKLKKYSFIDTMGLADTEETDDAILEKIQDFLKVKIDDIHWLVITVNGQDRLTNESTEVLLAILNFMECQKCTKNIIFCVTHSDGWSKKTKDDYMASLVAIEEFGKIFPNLANIIHFSGVADPDEQDEDDRNYLKTKEIQMRESLMKRFTNNGTILDELLKKWKRSEMDDLKAELAKARQISRRCSIL